MHFEEGLNFHLCIKRKISYTRSCFFFFLNFFRKNRFLVRAGMVVEALNNYSSKLPSYSAVTVKLMKLPQQTLNKPTR